MAARTFNQSGVDVRPTGRLHMRYAAFTYDQCGVFTRQKAILGETEAQSRKTKVCAPFGAPFFYFLRRGCKKRASALNLIVWQPRHNGSRRV